MFPSSYHHEIFRSYYHWQTWCPCKRSRSEVKGQGHRGKKNRPNWPRLSVVSCCFSGSSVKFQDHTALKFVEFDPHWAFPDCNSSLNSPMATKCCTKLKVVWKRCPFKVIRHIARSHGSEIVEFDPNWAFPDCNSSLNSPIPLRHSYFSANSPQHNS